MKFTKYHRVRVALKQKELRLERQATRSAIASYLAAKHYKAKGLINLNTPS